MSHDYDYALYNYHSNSDYDPYYYKDCGFKKYLNKHCTLHN